MSKQTPTCRCHCRGCGFHFSSLAAFDAHRFGDYSLPRNDLEARHCVSPEFSDAFGNEAGACRISSATDEIGAIWFLTADRAHVRAMFA